MIFKNAKIYTLTQPLTLNSEMLELALGEHEFLCKFSADVNDIHIVNSVESYLAKHEVVE